MVAKICLDSDVIIDVLRDNKETISTIKSLEAEFITTSINLFEIWSGRQKGEVITELISWLDILVFDKKAALVAGDMRRKLREKGFEIEIRDIFIAAVCITNGVTLFTKNKKHFERLKDFGIKLV